MTLSKYCYFLYGRNLCCHGPSCKDFFLYERRFSFVAFENVPPRSTILSFVWDWVEIFNTINPRFSDILIHIIIPWKIKIRFLWAKSHVNFIFWFFANFMPMKSGINGSYLSWINNEWSKRDDRLIWYCGRIDCFETFHSFLPSIGCWIVQGIEIFHRIKSCISQKFSSCKMEWKDDFARKDAKERML